MVDGATTDGPAAGLLSSFEEAERYGRVYTGGKVAVSHDATYVVCSCSEVLTIVDVSTGKLLTSITSEADDFTSFTLHPTTSELVAATRSRQVHHYAIDILAHSCTLVCSWN